MTPRTSFPFHTKWCQAIASLSASEQSEVLLAIALYGCGRDVPTLSPRSQVAFSFIRLDMDRDTAAYYDVVSRRSEGGKKGMARRWKKHGTSTVSTTVQPTVDHTAEPTVNPTVQPTVQPTVKSTVNTTVQPTVDHTAVPANSPANIPSASSFNNQPVKPNEPAKPTPSNPSREAPEIARVGAGFIPARVEKNLGRSNNSYNSLIKPITPITPITDNENECNNLSLIDENSDEFSSPTQKNNAPAREGNSLDSPNSQFQAGLASSSFLRDQLCAANSLSHDQYSALLTLFGQEQAASPHSSWTDYASHFRSWLPLFLSDVAHGRKLMPPTKPPDQRRADFIADIRANKKDYTQSTLSAFYHYWTQPTPTGHFLFETQRAWKTSTRLREWQKNHS